MSNALSIYLPRWPIWRARRASGPPPADPCENARPDEGAWLLVVADGTEQRVACACARAEAAGVRCGMTLAHARCLLGGRAVHERAYEPEKDAAQLGRLAQWLLRFAPVVAPDPPDGLLLDIAGCERLFGGPLRHLRVVLAALRTMGLRPRLSLAPTFGCAWAMARYGEREVSVVPAEAIEAALAPLPVAALRLAPATVEALEDVGVERVEQLLALPRDDLAARFGAAVLTRLDQATGAAAETIESPRVEPRFEVFQVFDGPVKNPEAVEQAMRALLTRLAAGLLLADRGALALEVELRRVDAAPERISLRLTHPNRDEAHLWTLLRGRLERAHLGFGVEEIRLRAARTARLNPRQRVFLRDAEPAQVHEPTALGELLDRLIDRLGERCVTQARPAETYLPEEAFVYQRAEGAAARVTKRPIVMRRVHPADRPAQLFRVPEPARVMSPAPEGPPAWVWWRGRGGRVVHQRGPERLSFSWWTPAVTGGRDYYEVEDEHGRRLWLYCDHRTSRWYVHGQWI